MSHQNQFVSQTIPTPPSTIPRASPAREDCWSEDATATLIEAWGRRYVDVNRGHLRQKQWQEVADTVNARHGHVLKARRTDVQCKNRIDTIKKKYKVEKARVVEMNGNYVSPWRFFETLDMLICGGTTPILKSTSILPQKRPAAAATMSQSPVVAVEGEGYFKRNYAAVAAAAAREEENEEESEDEDEEDEVEEEERDGDGIRKLARVIEEFGEMYARVEREKQRQLVELEKQRMEFAKEMECQRMQMLVEMQVQLEKIKRVKRSSSDNMYS